MATTGNEAVRLNEEKALLITELTEEKGAHFATLQLLHDERARTSALASQVSEIPGLKFSLEETQKLLISCQRKLVDERKKAAQHDEVVKGLQAEIEQLNDTNDRTQAMLEETLAKLDSSTKIITASPDLQELSDQQVRSEENEARLESLAARVTALEQERDTLTKDLHEARDALQTLQTQTSFLDTHKSSAEQELAELRVEYDRVCKELEVERLEVELSKDTFVDMQRQIQELTPSSPTSSSSSSASGQLSEEDLQRHREREEKKNREYQDLMEQFQMLQTELKKKDEASSSSEVNQETLQQALHERDVMQGEMDTLKTTLMNTETKLTRLTKQLDAFRKSATADAKRNQETIATLNKNIEEKDITIQSLSPVPTRPVLVPPTTTNASAASNKEDGQPSPALSSQNANGVSAEMFEAVMRKVEVLQIERETLMSEVELSHAKLKTLQQQLTDQQAQIQQAQEYTRMQQYQSQQQQLQMAADPTAIFAPPVDFYQPPQLQSEMKTIIETLSMELSEVKARCKAAEKRAGDLTGALDAALADASAHKKTLDESVHEMYSATHAKESLTKDLETLQSEFQTLSRSHHHELEQAESRKQSLRAAQTELGEATRTNDRLTGQLAQLKQSYENLTLAREKSESTFRTRCEDLEVQIERMNRDYETEVANSTSLKQTLARLEAEKAAMGNTSDEALVALERETHDLRARIDELEEERLHLQRALSEATTAAATTRDTLSRGESDNIGEDAADDVASGSNNANNNNREKEDDAALVENQNQIIQQLQADILNMRERQLKLIERASELEQQLEEERMEKAEIHSNLTDARDKIREAFTMDSATLEEAIAQKNELELNVADLTAALERDQASFQLRLHNLENELEYKNNLIAQLEAEVDDLKIAAQANIGEGENHLEDSDDQGDDDEDGVEDEDEDDELNLHQHRHHHHMMNGTNSTGSSGRRTRMRGGRGSRRARIPHGNDGGGGNQTEADMLQEQVDLLEASLRITEQEREGFRTQCDQIKMTLFTLENELADKENDYDEIDRQYSELKTRFLELEMEYHILTDQKNLVEESLQHQLQQGGHADQAVTVLEGQLANEKSNVEQLTRRLRDSDRIVADLQHQLSVAQTEVQTLQHHASESSNQLDPALMQAAVQERDNLQAALEDLRNRADEHREARSIVEEKLEEATHAKERIEGELVKVQEMQIIAEDEHQAERTSLRDDLNQALTRKREYKDEIATLRNDRQNDAQRMTSLDEEVRTLKHEKESLEDKLAQLFSEKGHAERATSPHSPVSDSEGSIEEGIVASLQARIQDLQAELDKTKQERHAISLQVFALEEDLQELEALRRGAEGMIAEKTDLTKNLMTASQEISRLERDLQAQTEGLLTIQNERDRLRDDVARAHNDAEDRADELARALRDNDALQAEAEQLRHDKNALVRSGAQSPEHEETLVRNEELEAEKRNVAHEKDSLEANLAQITRERDRSLEDVERLQNEVGTLTTRVREGQAEIEKLSRDLATHNNEVQRLTSLDATRDDQTRELHDQIRDLSALNRELEQKMEDTHLNSSRNRTIKAR
eukprot:TRINITY_DN3222_c0_g1_i5.p1 TRINITY_DN3222_c0_g1~~TRINITY_DN3222_c0_g1_i5.p1  ORF type:complete len:1566 (-),score=452.32 TRINITY_DN3222_c0_g1_i5:1440-6137(-)